MKASFNILFLGLVGLFLASCGNAPAGEKVETGAALEVESSSSDNGLTFAVNTDESQINWIGSKLAGKQHTGYIKLSNGSLGLKEGQLVSGKFTIDMNSITDTDMQPGDGKEKLEGHLKADDFFGIENHPTGAFQIVKVEAASGQPGVTHNITGNLTLKGITKSVTIPAVIGISENELVATTPGFTINRTEWDIKYGSGIIGTAKDKIINDEVGLQISLKATPQ